MKLLYDRKQYQGMKKSVTLSFSLESWYYVKSHIAHFDLMVSSCSGQTMMTLVRIDSPDSMQIDFNVNGITFGIGIWNKPPNKNEPHWPTHFGDIANVVEVALPENASLAHHEHIKEFVAQGVDFIYDDSCCKLKIQIWHRRVYAQK
jgi:hypothetical protein